MFSQMKGSLENLSSKAPAFYSQLFLVEKASRGWRPVLYLTPLNEYVMQTKVRMEVATSVLASIRKGARIHVKVLAMKVDPVALFTKGPSHRTGPSNPMPAGQKWPV